MTPFTLETTSIRFLFLSCCSFQWSVFCPWLSGVFNRADHPLLFAELSSLSRTPYSQLPFSVSGYFLLDSFAGSFFFFLFFQSKHRTCSFSISIFILLIISSRFSTLNTTYMLITPNLYLSPCRSLPWTPGLCNQHLTFQFHLDVISCRVQIRNRGHTEIWKSEESILTKWPFTKVWAECWNRGRQCSGSGSAADLLRHINLKWWEEGTITRNWKKRIV